MFQLAVISSAVLTAVEHIGKMAYPGHRIGPNGETYNPTLKAPKEINLEQDCMALNNAMKGAGKSDPAP
ncbi:hypothetical protein P879_10093 [Paragonimus westermani]|uniref:Uncharacterized protein n=1 Tax=Paragonimus westermani TaxID=34504 RepID=A0A8T0DFB0_9TREM|nr:hypothetical protein P879_10093 [Paragonimus westermani]